MDGTVDISVDFDDRTADHDEIDFDISTPRDQPEVSDLDLPNDPHSLVEQHSEIPSIVITEPSSVNLKDLEESDNDVDDVGKTQAETSDDVSKSEAIFETDFSVSTQEQPEGSTQEQTDGSDKKPDPDKETVSQREENQVSENERTEDFEKIVKAVEQDTELVDQVNAEGTVRNEFNATQVHLDDKQDERIPGKITNLDMSESTKADDFIDEVDETVSLDNIMMKDKSESDSDSEFDFDLPPAASNTSTVKPMQQVPTVKPPEPVTESQLNEPRIVVSTGVPAGSHDSSAGTTTPQSSSNSSQKPVPTISQDLYTGSPAPQASSSGTQKPVAVIKPTSQPVQAPYIVPPPPDEGTQQVLESAQAEWDKVTTIQAGFKDTDTSVKGVEPTVVQTVEPMSPHELTQIIKQDDFSNVRGSIKPTVERHGFSAFVSFLFGPPKLHRDLIDERDRLFCIAASQLNNDDSSHIRTLQTIYRCLTGSKFDCARIGSHWEEIGFQGTDPATDLRGAGILGLLNLLHILKDPKKYQLASDIYRLSLHPTQNFPFCVMGINLSRISLQTLREGLLNKECNRRHEVIGVVNDFYVGLYLQLYQVWKGQGKTISDSGFVIKDIEMKAKKSPRDVFKNLEEYLNRKTVVIKEKSIDFGGDNFTNVCDDGP
ncbi:msx2-interacting protein-like [Mercenaria mercenaria]|uniref:msx2-interacting protein-like n=1 Tax=Mercenaria mercenaria TaxID=6596 RepID=UPI00234EDD39|nr:msx2-interacting protein-like [Mercenaria mercenaria]